RDSIVLIVDPFLPEGVADPQHRTSENLPAERARMENGSNVRHGEVIRDVVFAGFDIDFDFGKPRDVRMRLTVARHGIGSYCQQALARECSGRRSRHLVDALRQLVAVIDAAELDGSLSGLRERHTRTATLAEDSFTAHVVVVGAAAEILGGDLAQLVFSIE